VNRQAAFVVAGWLAWVSAPAAGPPEPGQHIQISAEPQGIADFTLTNQHGQPVRFSELRGRNALVFFGFTHCPSICPTAMFTMKSVVDSIEQSGEEPPAVVLISIDGEAIRPKS
jgi:protein SCO1/2